AKIDEVVVISQEDHPPDRQETIRRWIFSTPSADKERDDWVEILSKSSIPVYPYVRPAALEDPTVFETRALGLWSHIFGSVGSEKRPPAPQEPPPAAQAAEGLPTKESGNSLPAFGPGSGRLLNNPERLERMGDPFLNQEQQTPLNEDENIAADLSRLIGQLLSDAPYNHHRDAGELVEK